MKVAMFRNSFAACYRILTLKAAAVAGGKPSKKLQSHEFNK
jgi:hypothetical protein